MRNASRLAFILVGLLISLKPVAATTVAVIFYDNRFGTVNDVNGAYTQIGTLPIKQAGGIAAINSLLYVEDFSNNLYSVDPITGTAKLAGNTGLNLSLAAFGGAAGGLFEIDAQSVLYSINMTTGAAQLVGKTGLAANNGMDDTSMSSDGQYLYYTAGASGAKDELYRIDPKTGVATDMGSTGQTGIAGSAYVGGSLELYQYGQSKNYIYTSALGGTVNFLKGAQLSAQIVDGGVVLNTLANNAVLSSSALANAAPEPPARLTEGLGLLCLFAMAGRARLKKHRHPPNFQGSVNV